MIVIFFVDGLAYVRSALSHTLYILLYIRGAIRESLPRSFHMRVTVWRRIRSSSKTVHIFMGARHISPICSSMRSHSADSFRVRLNEPCLKYGVIILSTARGREREKERINVKATKSFALLNGLCSVPIAMRFTRRFSKLDLHGTFSSAARTSCWALFLRIFVDCGMSRETGE